VPEHDRKQKRRQKLNSRVARRDPLGASAAFTAQYQPTKDRNFVVRFYRFTAVWASLIRKYNRLFIRYAVDDDIKKTADDRTENENENVCDEVRQTGDRFERRRKISHKIRIETQRESR
jgi:hypothetical protein